jgi:hypothetical protein
MSTERNFVNLSLSTKSNEMYLFRLADLFAVLK